MDTPILQQHQTHWSCEKCLVAKLSSRLRIRQLEKWMLMERQSAMLLQKSTSLPAACIFVSKEEPKVKDSRLKCA